MVELRLEGLAQFEIAERLACSERTVRRILSGLKSRFEVALSAP